MNCLQLIVLLMMINVADDKVSDGDYGVFPCRPHTSSVLPDADADGACHSVLPVQGLRPR